MNENITPEVFCHWLNVQLNDPTQPLPDILSISEMLSKVALGESIATQAVREHEKLIAFMQAGFTRKEALQIVLAERTAFISAAVGGIDNTQE